MSHAKLKSLIPKEKYSLHCIIDNNTVYQLIINSHSNMIWKKLMESTDDSDMPLFDTKKEVTKLISHYKKNSNLLPTHQLIDFEVSKGYAVKAENGTYQFIETELIEG
jgi:adenosine deaminase